MAREWLTDEQVYAEMERLKKSPHVKLARKELRLKYRYRQALYSLRNLEKRGKELAALGITSDMLDEMAKEADRDDE